MIAAVLAEKDFDTVLEIGVRPKHFGELEAQELFKAVEAYYQDHAHFTEVISEDLLLEAFPAVELPEPKQTLKALCQKVMLDSLRRNMRLILSESEDLVEEDPVAAMSWLSRKMAELAETAEKVPDVDFAEDAVDDCEPPKPAS